MKREINQWEWVCDRCGKTATVGGHKAELPPGWGFLTTTTRASRTTLKVRTEDVCGPCVEKYAEHHNCLDGV